MKKITFLLLCLSILLTGFTQEVGDYRSAQTGFFSSTTTWERFNGTTWTSITTAQLPRPSLMTSDQTITIRNGHTVTYALSYPTLKFKCNLAINQGGELIASTISIPITVTLYAVTDIAGNFSSVDGSVMNVVITSTALVTIESTGTVTITGSLSSPGVDNLVIKSTAANATGSLIYETGTPYATVERYVQEGGWHFVAPATTGVTPQNFNFDENNPTTLSRWNEPTRSWVNYSETSTTPLALGNGYVFEWQSSPSKSSSTPGIVEFKGKLTATELYKTLSYTTTNPDPNNMIGYNMLGNPWASSIKLSDADVIDIVNVEPTVWIWDEASGYLQWASVGNPSGNNNSPNEMNPAVVAVGQGVAMRALGPGASVRIKPIHRAHNQNAIFWKEAEAEETEQVPYLKVEVIKDNRSDRAYVTFGENGTTGFESYWDVSKMFGLDTDSYLYLEEDNHKYAKSHLQSLNEAEDRLVNLYFRAGSDGEHRLIADQENLPNVTVYLEDTELGKLVEFDQNTPYTFNALKGDREDRFVLHFKSVTVPSNTIEDAEFVSISAFDKAVYIRNKDISKATVGRVNIYDIYGRELYSSASSYESVVRIPVDVNNSYLIVKVSDGKNMVTKKVFIK